MSPPNDTSSLTILDFETPNPPIKVDDPISVSATQSATPKPHDAPTAFSRSSYQPHSGLWSLLIPVNHALALRHNILHNKDLRLYNTFYIQVMETSGVAHGGTLLARSYIEDNAGHRFASDAYPIISHWQAVPLDIQMAQQEGVAIDQIAAVGLQIEPANADKNNAPTINVQTDDWFCSSAQKLYTGQRLGAPGTFYVQREGTRLEVGAVHQFEMVFHDRAGIQRPWLEILQDETNQRVLGQDGSGLMLLDQDQFDALSPGLHQAAIVGGEISKTDGKPLPARRNWPGQLSQWTAQCVWSSSAGAIVEVQQTVGPFDRLGRPATNLTWRFMIYPTGQVYIHLIWRHDSDVKTPDPVTWALSLDRATIQPHVEQPERLLKDIYPEALRHAVLPHQMQVGAPLHLLAKVGGDESSLYWWADAGNCRLFGVGLPAKNRNGPLDAVLLVNKIGVLEVAGSFSQYLTGPALTMKIGKQDMNFPGDFDNDGVVEPYGFQAIRLSNGQAVFELDPQGRPIYYPAFLISNPIGSPSLDGSRILSNIDGQQIADPPHWPDGSYILQLPWVITKPVHIEVRAIPNVK